MTKKRKRVFLKNLKETRHRGRRRNPIVSEMVKDGFPDVQMALTLNNLLSLVLPATPSLLFPEPIPLSDRVEDILIRIATIAHGDEPKRIDKIAALAQEALDGIQAAKASVQ